MLKKIIEMTYCYERWVLVLYQSDGFSMMQSLTGVASSTPFNHSTKIKRKSIIGLQMQLDDKPIKISI